VDAAETQPDEVLRRWRWLWGRLARCQERGHVEDCAALGAEIVNLGSVLRARYRAGRRRRRKGAGGFGSGF
jgi:hypothetical protein